MKIVSPKYLMSKHQAQFNTMSEYIVTQVFRLKAEGKPEKLDERQFSKPSVYPPVHKKKALLH